MTGGIIGSLYALFMKAPEKPNEPVSNSMSSGITEQQKAEYAAQLDKYQQEKESYDNKRTLIASVSGGAVAGGLVIHLFGKGKYTKTEINSKEITSANPLSGKQVEIYYDGHLHSTVYTNSSGNATFDLTQFVDYDRSVTFNFKIPNYDFFEDSLSIPASYFLRLRQERDFATQAKLLTQKADDEREKKEEEKNRISEQKYVPMKKIDAIRQWKLFRNNEAKYIGTITTWRFKCSYVSNEYPFGELPKSNKDIGNYYKVAIDGPENFTYAAAAMLGRFPKIVKDDWLIVTCEFTEVTSSGVIVLRPIKVENLGYRGYSGD
jgi:hypothetical protein